MNRLGFACIALSFFPATLAAQVPPNAKVFKDLTARFQPGAEQVRVVFYTYQPKQQGIGVVLLSGSGKLLGKADDLDANTVDPATGVYDVGAGVPDIILASGVGAKTHDVKIFSFQDSELKEIFNWSGWHFEVVRLRGQPVIAVTDTDYSTLPKLYTWKGGQFVEASQDFPEFFDKAVKDQQDTIARTGLPLTSYVQACDLAAKALVYSKKYPDALNLCQQALKVVESSPGVLPNETNAGPDQFAGERREAAANIQDTLNAVTTAQREGAANLRR